MTICTKNKRREYSYSLDTTLTSISPLLLTDKPVETGDKVPRASFSKRLFHFDMQTGLWGRTGLEDESPVFFQTLWDTQNNKKAPRWVRIHILAKRMSTSSFSPLPSFSHDLAFQPNFFRMTFKHNQSCEMLIFHGLFPFWFVTYLVHLGEKETRTEDLFYERLFAWEKDDGNVEKKKKARVGKAESTRSSEREKKRKGRRWKKGQLNYSIWLLYPSMTLKNGRADSTHLLVETINDIWNMFQSV